MITFFFVSLLFRTFHSFQIQLHLQKVIYHYRRNGNCFPGILITQTASSNISLAYLRFLFNKMSDKGLTHEELEDKTKPSSSKTGLKTVPSQSKTRGFVVSNLNSAAKINGGSGKPITRPNSGKSTTKGHTKTSTTECTEADKRGGSGKKSYSGKSSDFGSAENDLASKKVQQKRPRQASSSDEQIPHKQKSSAPNAYRTKKKWRKLQEGSLGEYYYLYDF